MSQRICVECGGGIASHHAATTRCMSCWQNVVAARRLARFWARVDRSDANGCWPWLGARDVNGYGRLGHRLAHREMFVVLGRDPGETIDHLCRNHACVNPAHLESVPSVENVRRGMAFQTTCRRAGHPLDGRVAATGYRYCKTCHRLRERARVLIADRRSGPRRTSVEAVA